MNLIQIYHNAIEKLVEAGVENAAFDAKVMFETVFGVRYAELILEPDMKYDKRLCPILDSLLEQRISGRPLQYIIGKWDFMDYTFCVGEGVLIPRPETEQLVEYVVDRLKNVYNPVIFDLCAGSGCIGLSIKKYLPSTRVFMIEKSSEALEYLCLNRETLELSREVSVIQGDIMNGFKGFSLPEPDVILSNPPYIKSAELSSLQKEVQREPKMALDGGEDGLVFYRCLAEKWLPYLKKGGFIAVECGEEQGDYISSMFLSECDKSQIINDFSNLQRIVIGEKEAEERK